MKKDRMRRKRPSTDDLLWAFVSLFFGVLGIVLALALQQKNKYVLFYVKESLALVIISGGIMYVGLLIPFIGWFVILPLGCILLLVLWIIGIVNAVSGEMKSIPLTGILAKEFKF